MMKSPRHASWLVLTLAAATILGFVLINFVLKAHSPTTDRLAQIYEIPPLFGQHRAFYALVLAMMMSASALSIGALIENIRFLGSGAAGRSELAWTHVANESVLLLAFIFAITPDVYVLLSWGESMAPSTSDVSQFDRAMDAVCAFTLFIYLWRRTRVQPVMLFQLQRNPIPVDLEPTWEQLRPKLLIAMSIIALSFGVAFGK